MRTDGKLPKFDSLTDSHYSLTVFLGGLTDIVEHKMSLYKKAMFRHQIIPDVTKGLQAYLESFTKNEYLWWYL